MMKHSEFLRLKKERLVREHKPVADLLYQCGKYLAKHHDDKFFVDAVMDCQCWYNETTHLPECTCDNPVVGSFSSAPKLSDLGM